MNVSLVMVSADGKTREVALTTFPSSIGRGEECRIRIPVAAVSRKHCELVIDDEELVVNDLKSANGTYVNGMRIRTRELVPGDLLNIGAVVFVVRINGHPKEVDAKEAYAAGIVEAHDRVSTRPATPSADTAQSNSGVPPWPKTGAAAPGKGAPAPAGGNAKPAPAVAGAGPAKSAKPDDDDDDGDLDDLLADLDLSGLDDDDDDEPKKPAKK